MNIHSQYTQSGISTKEGPVIETLRIDPKAVLPKRAHSSDGGADIYSNVTVTIAPGESMLVPTGIAIKIPYGYAGFLMNRSSQRVNKITSLGEGLIDADYRGELKVFIDNQSKVPYSITAYETRIAQLVIVPVVLATFVDTWNDTSRGNGGFGSTK